MHNEVYGVMRTVKTRVHDEGMTAVEKLVIAGVELAMKSVIASSRRATDSVLQTPVQRSFSRNIEGLQMIASSMMNSNTDSKRLDETFGSVTVEGGDLTVKVRNFDRPVPTHQRD